MAMQERRTTVLAEIPVAYTEAFSLEYRPDTPREAIRNDVVSYLAEYRLNIQESSHEQVYSDGKVREPVKHQAMTDIGRRAIESRKTKGFDTKRSEADLLGMERIENEIPNAQNGDVFIYASPPDEAEGYTYGFLYTARVTNQDHANKKLHWKSIRIDNNQNLENYNAALSEVAQRTINFSLSNDFPANPLLVRQNRFTDQDPDTVINFILDRFFNRNFDPAKQAIHENIIRHMSNQIEDFIDKLKRGLPQDELRHYFCALENQAIALKRQFEQKGALLLSFDTQVISMYAYIGMHGKSSPKVTGSCGSSTESNNIFGYNGTFSLGKLFNSPDSDKYGSLEFKCPSPNCGRTNRRKPGELLASCQHCGKPIKKC